MIKIQRKLKINNYEPVVYNIYTKDEFDKPYIYWKDCNAGDWGISDDGYISECIARNEYETSTEMVFPYGKQFLYEEGIRIPFIIKLPKSGRNSGFS